MSTTTNFGWTLPTVGGSDDSWGTTLNQTISDIDDALHNVDITYTQNGASVVNITNASPGAMAQAGFRQSNGTHIANVAMTGAGYTPTVNYDPADGVYFVTDGSGGFNIATVNAAASISFFTGTGASSSKRVQLDSNGNVVVGRVALATNAADGFLYIPTCAGAPTGTPTAFSGRAPIIFDSSNNKLYLYNGSWKGVTLS